MLRGHVCQGKGGFHRIKIVVHDRTRDNMTAVDTKLASISLVVVVKCLMLSAEFMTFRRVREVSSKILSYFLETLVWRRNWSKVWVKRLSWHLCTFIKTEPLSQMGPCRARSSLSRFIWVTWDFNCRIDWNPFINRIKCSVIMRFSINILTQFHFSTTFSIISSTKLM